MLYSFGNFSGFGIKYQEKSGNPDASNNDVKDSFPVSSYQETKISETYLALSAEKIVNNVRFSHMCTFILHTQKCISYTLTNVHMYFIT
jgi:hypothetical protein